MSCSPVGYPYDRDVGVASFGYPYDRDVAAFCSCFVVLPAQYLTVERCVQHSQSVRHVATRLDALVVA